MDEHREEQEPQRWVTIHRGPMWEVVALQAKLEAHGVPADLPDQTIKTFDPFVTGADPLGVSLAVPEGAVEEARRLLLTERESGGDALPLPEDEPEVTPAARDLAARTRRLRWTAVFALMFFLFVLVGVWGVVQGIGYLSAVDRAGAPPPGHGLNLAAIGVCALSVVAGVAWFLYQASV